VIPALRKALESDRDDVRLLAAELLAERKDDSAVPALAAFLVPDGPSIAAARKALSTCATDAAAIALATHLQELAALPAAADPAPMNALKRDAVGALAATRRTVGLPALIERFEDSAPEVRAAALSGALLISNHRRPPAKGAPSRDFLKEEKRYPRNAPAVLQTLRAAVKAKDPALRATAARELDIGTEPENDTLLISLFGDRDVATRVQAVASYAQRVEKHNAPLAALEAVIAQGSRELMLNAAEGLAAKQHAASLRPLLLFTRAGEVEEQVRAVLALGTGGQLRALEEMELLAAGGTEEAPVDPLVRAAAIEALGRLYRSLTDVEQKKRVLELVEANALEGNFRLAGVRGLRWIGERPPTASAGGGLERAHQGGDDRALGRLQQIVAAEEDRDVEVRKEAIRALAVLADPSSEKVLTRALFQWQLADTALQALEACFPNDPLRVAMNAASSELPAISGPALAYLLAEAEPAPLLERLANPRLRADLRAKVKYGLGRRPTLPTDALVKYAVSEFASVRDDMAWLMARHALAGSNIPAAEKEQRAKSLVASATSTATRWAKSVGSDKAAEESAFLRLLWAATLHASREVEELAAKSLSGGSPAPASVRAESARVLVKAGSGAVPVLLKGASDIDGGVRRAAVSAIVATNPAQAVALIESSKPLDALAFDAVKGDAMNLATEAARAVMLPKLIGAGDPSVLMTQAEKGSSEAVQRAALLALGRMGGEAVAEFLAKLAFSAGGGEDGDDEDGGDEDEEEPEDDDDGGDEDEDGDEDSGPSPDVSMPGSRRFEFEEDDSSKFWEVMVQDKSVIVRFGKIGSAGQKKPKALASPEAAQKEMEKLIREKTGKGYSEVKLKGIAAPKAVAAPKPAAAPKAAKEAKVEWGTPSLREAAFRALRRAQRTNLRRANAPKWFTPEQLVALAANPELAESMMPAAPVKPARASRDDDDEGDDDDGGDEDEDYDEDDDE
jgi:ParB family chromosome partitioning protein